MDTENEKPDPEYIRKFNQGYILAKYMPGLSEQISKSKSEIPNFRAIQDGRSFCATGHPRYNLRSKVRLAPVVGDF